MFDCTIAFECATILLLQIILFGKSSALDSLAFAVGIYLGLVLRPCILRAWIEVRRQVFTAEAFIEAARMLLLMVVPLSIARIC